MRTPPPAILTSQAATDPRTPEGKTTMTGTLDLPSFPLPRAARCPMDPPPYADEAMRSNRIEQVRIWDGTTPWMITRYDQVRQILSDPRTSADIQRPGFPDWSPSAAAAAV